MSDKRIDYLLDAYRFGCPVLAICPNPACRHEGEVDLGRLITRDCFPLNIAPHRLPEELARRRIKLRCTKCGNASMRVEWRMPPRSRD